MSPDAKAFIGWNEALFGYFFPHDLGEDEEVSLFVDRELINEIGNRSGFGGYEEFLHSVMLPIDDRKRVYMELRQWNGMGERLSREQRRLFSSQNLFDYATLFIDHDLYSHSDCPFFLAYLVFTILMGCECYRLERRDIGAFMTERIREWFPNHSERRDSLCLLFNALADKHPQFQAERLTELKYIGLIQYQLVLSKTQENKLKKAMYSADLSDELPYELWALKLRDYTDDSERRLLNDSIHNAIYRQRISSLRSSFDPVLYEETHRNEDICSRGSFVLAVYEDEYTADNDRLVLLTDINNKTITDRHLKIEKGSIDRLGEYAQYNINHVLIDNDDKAEMKRYTLNTPSDRVSSEALGNIVTFSRYSSRYLIQTQYPRREKDTYILVRNNCEDEWGQWLQNHGSPAVCAETNNTRVVRVFGAGWRLYYSQEVESSQVNNTTNTLGGGINMDGGIKCSGMNKVYLASALPYFEFPEPINPDRLRLYINIDDVLIENSQYIIRFVEGTKLVIEFPGLEAGGFSHEVSITIEYTSVNQCRLKLHKEFSIIDQDIKYNDEDLLLINMWGSIRDAGEDIPYMKGFQLFNGKNAVPLPQNTALYYNLESRIDIEDRRFYLVNLFAAICSMKGSFSATEKQLEKSIRYAAARFDMDIASNNSFYRDVKYMLINCGFINADYENKKYQPLPPTFVQTPMAMIRGNRLFMLVGSYTRKFLYDLDKYCIDNNIRIYQHSYYNQNNKEDVSSLMPPVILLGHTFNPDRFMRYTNSKCVFISEADIAVNIFRSLPTYSVYRNTLCAVPNNIIDRRQFADPRDEVFPRIRESRALGYGSLRWIEMADNSLHQITIQDSAWAGLYCLHMRNTPYCTKDINSLIFPVNLHLPVMMQRALYLTNPGLPKKEKAFICYNDNDSNNYFNVVKRYDIKDAPSSTRTPHIVRAITGREDNELNPSLRKIKRCPYKLFLWNNENKHSSYPRSLMVMTDRTGNSVLGFAIKCGGGMKIYFGVGPNNSRFRLVDGNDVNLAFSKFMTSNGTWQQLGISFRDEFASLPPEGEYNKKEITII